MLYQVDSGRVRVSRGPRFVFCKEAHPLVASGQLPPSSTTELMGTDEFVRRLRLGLGFGLGLGLGFGLGLGLGLGLGC